MKLSAIILARVLGYIETADLNPRGKVFFPDVVPQIVQRYKFQKYPQTFDQLDESKGIDFYEGKIQDKVIQKFTIWGSLLLLETRSSTSEAKTILEGMLEWGAETFGLNYKSGMIKRFAYVSDLTFYSDVPLLRVSPALAKLGIQTSKALSDIWREPIEYEPLNLVVGHDPTARKYQIAPFSITRRAEAKFSENKYFSEAPLPTDTHISLLEGFEADVKRMNDPTIK